MLFKEKVLLIYPVCFGVSSEMDISKVRDVNVREHVMTFPSPEKKRDYDPSCS